MKHYMSELPLFNWTYSMRMKSQPNKSMFINDILRKNGVRFVIVTITNWHSPIQCLGRDSDRQRKSPYLPVVSSGVAVACHEVVHSRHH